MRHVDTGSQRGLQQRLAGSDWHDMLLAIESEAKSLDQALR